MERPFWVMRRGPSWPLILVSAASLLFAGGVWLGAALYRSPETVRSSSQKTVAWRWVDLSAALEMPLQTRLPGHWQVVEWPALREVVIRSPRAGTRDGLREGLRFLRTDRSQAWQPIVAAPQEAALLERDAFARSVTLVDHANIFAQGLLARVGIPFLRYQVPTTNYFGGRVRVVRFVQSVYFLESMDGAVRVEATSHPRTWKRYRKAFDHIVRRTKIGSARDARSMPRGSRAPTAASPSYRQGDAGAPHPVRF